MLFYIRTIFLILTVILIGNALYAEDLTIMYIIDKDSKGIPTNPYIESATYISIGGFAFFSRASYPINTISNITKITINIDKGQASYINNIFLLKEINNPYITSGKDSSFEIIKDTSYSINDNTVTISINNNQIQIIQALEQRLCLIIFEIDKNTPINTEFQYTISNIEATIPSSLIITYMNELPSSTGTYTIIDGVPALKLKNVYAISGDKTVSVSWNIPEYPTSPLLDFKGIRVWRTDIGEGVVSDFSDPWQSSALLVYDSVYGPNNSNGNGFIDTTNLTNGNTYTYTIISYDNNVTNSQTNSSPAKPKINDEIVNGTTNSHFTIASSIISISLSDNPVSSYPIKPKNVRLTSIDFGMQLEWNSPEDSNTCYYKIYRKSSKASVPSPISDKIYVGKGTNYLDTDVSVGQSYYYQVRSVDITGKLESQDSDVIKGYYKPITSAEKIAIYPNYFNVSDNEFLQISLNLPNSEHVKIQILTLSGRLIKYLSDDELPAGKSYFRWYGGSGDEVGKGKLVSPGTYILNVEADSFSEKTKIYIIRDGANDNKGLCGESSELSYSIFIIFIIYLRRRIKWLLYIK